MMNTTMKAAETRRMNLMIDDSEIQIDLESVDDNIHRLPPEKFNMHLVQMISAYWNSSGHAIRVWSEVMGKGSKYCVYTIKSDTVNGKPLT